MYKGAISVSLLFVMKNFQQSIELFSAENVFLEVFQRIIRFLQLFLEDLQVNVIFVKVIYLYL